MSVCVALWMKKVQLNEHNWIQSRGYRKQVLLSGHDLESQGALVQIVVIPSKCAIQDHYHQTSREFYYVMAGECIVVLNGTESVLRAGDMLLTEPGDIHSLRNVGQEEFRLLVFKTNCVRADTFWVDD